VIPLWKFKRELLRPLHQLIDLPFNLASKYFGAIYFDLLKRIKKYTGELPITSKIAIYVIFPRTSELNKSHLRSLRYIVDNKYSPIVISNSIINEEQINILKKYASIIIVRPNFGYDFGAYRQGILEVLGRGIETEHLLLINDSCWFPTFGDINWIQQAEQKGLDLVGVTSNYGISRNWGQKSNRDWTWDYSSKHKNFHYCSFALLLSKNVIYNPKFIQFWRRFPLTNKKSKVVRRGEIGLTRLIINLGFSHGETFSIEQLPKRLESLDKFELKEVLNHLIIPEDRHLLEAYEDIVSEDKIDSIAMRNFILRSVARQGASYGLAYFMNHFGETPFLKKSPFFSNPKARENSIKILHKLPIEVSSEILTECTIIEKNNEKV
jgi:hypothetical protein